LFSESKQGTITVRYRTISTELVQDCEDAMEYLMYPPTVKAMAAEIITACDDYLARKIGLEPLKQLILHYASTSPNMLFNAQSFNPTILNRIGKKRAAIIEKLLDGYQQRF